jgi:hypothetical protein
LRSLRLSLRRPKDALRLNVLFLFFSFFFSRKYFDYAQYKIHQKDKAIYPEASGPRTVAAPSTDGRARARGFRKKICGNI